MASELKAAVNSFKDGLLMDFSPTIALNTTLSNALNATLITYNGNERVLQNDMGNARVESAYLPEGYVPVGTCEFGDIIYIVSYNPLKNKSLIGCFPSPERNISNKEVSKLHLSIEASDLAENGKVYNNSIKKIIYSNSLSAGDKFIISWGNEGASNLNYISNFGNTTHSLKNTEGYWPKITKIYVVSIDETGKMTLLSDDVKWYSSKTEDNDTSNDYIISDISFIDKDSGNVSSDLDNLDLYRTALQLKYSVFLSKTSGKLALLLELETITGFNCGHKLLQHTASDGSTIFDVYFSASWTTDNYNINPSGMLVTKSEFVNMQPANTMESNYLDIDPNNIITTDKVMEFSRLYRMEEPQSTYDDFLKKSYYNNVEKYSTFRTDLFKDFENINNTAIADSIKDALFAEATIKPKKLKSSNSTEELSSDTTNIESRKKLQDEIKDLSVFDDKIKTIIRYYKKDDNIKIRIPYEEEIEEDSDVFKKGMVQRYYIPNAEKYDKIKKKYYTTIHGKTYEAAPIVLPDDIVVNLFKKSVLVKVGSFTKKEITENSSDAQYLINYTVCPCMPYGPLSYLSISNTIDFNKNLDGSVDLSTWRYYVTNNSLTLNFGFNTALKEDENEVIDKVVMEFYDNLGICASYLLNNQDTYDSKFTEYFLLDTDSGNNRMSNIKYSNSNNAYVEEQIIHASGNGATARANIEDADLNKYVMLITKDELESDNYVELLDGSYLLSAEYIKTSSKNKDDFKIESNANSTSIKVKQLNTVTYTCSGPLYTINDLDINKLPTLFISALQLTLTNNAKAHFSEANIHNNIFTITSENTRNIYYYVEYDNNVYGGPHGDSYVLLDVLNNNSSKILAFSFIDESCKVLDSYALYTINVQGKDSGDIESGGSSSETTTPKWDNSSSEYISSSFDNVLANISTCAIQSYIIDKFEKSNDAVSACLLEKQFSYKQDNKYDKINVEKVGNTGYIVVTEEDSIIPDGYSLYIGNLSVNDPDKNIKILNYYKIDFNESIYLNKEYSKFIFFLIDNSEDTSTKDDSIVSWACIYEITYTPKYSENHTFILKAHLEKDSNKIALTVLENNKFPEGFEGQCKVIADSFEKTYDFNSDSPIIYIDRIDSNFTITILKDCYKYYYKGHIIPKQVEEAEIELLLIPLASEKDWYMQEDGSYVFKEEELEVLAELKNIPTDNNYCIGFYKNNTWEYYNASIKITIYNTCSITLGVFKSNEGSVKTLLQLKTFSFISPAQLQLLYRNDAGILYYGKPYLVKINIYKGNVNDIGVVDTDAYPKPLTLWRWLWTAPVFNDLYSNIQDFKDCLLTVGLDCNAEFDSTRLLSNYSEYVTQEAMTDPNIELTKENSVGFNVLKVGWDSITKKYNSAGNIAFRGIPTTADSYGSSLFLYLEEDALNKYNVTMSVTNHRISVDDTSIVYDSDNLTEDFKELLPIIGTPNKDPLFETKENLKKEKDDKTLDLEQAKDTFNLDFINEKTGSETFNYLDSDGNYISSTCNTFTVSADKWRDSNTSVYLNLTGSKFNKVGALTRTLLNNTKYIKSLIETEDDLFSYGIKIDSEGIPYYEKIPYLGYSEKGGDKTWLLSGYFLFRSSTDACPNFYYTSWASTGQELSEGGDKANLNSEFLNPFIRNTIDSPIQQYIFGPGFKRGEINSLRIKGISPNSLNKYMGNSKEVDAITGSIDSSNFYPKAVAVSSTNYENTLTPSNNSTKPFSSTNDIKYIYSLLSLNTGDSIYGLGDGGVLLVPYGAMDLSFAWKQGTTTEQQRAAKNYAQVVTSLLMLLYTVQELPEDKFTFSNIAKLKDFKEYWKADILVKLKLNAPDELANKYVIINPHYTSDGKVQFTRLYDYVSAVLIASKYSSKDTFIDSDNNEITNTDPSIFCDSKNVIPDIKETVKCIEFKYEMPYEVQSLIDNYYASDNTVTKYINNVYNYDWYSSLKESKSVEKKSISLSLNVDTLYTNNNGAFTSFSGGSRFYLLNKFTKVGDTIVGFKTKDLYLLDVNKYSNLSKALGVSGKNLYFKDVSALDLFDLTYDFLVNCSGDNPRVSGLKLTHLFNYGKLK